jgi:hypothetical protein
MGLLVAFCAISISDIMPVSPQLLYRWTGLFNRSGYQ